MIFDLAVAAVLLVSAGIAFFRGFIREVLTILGVVGGLVAAYFGGPMLAPIVLGWLGTGTDDDPKKLFDIIPYDIVADAVAYGAIFIIVVIVLSIASHLLSGWAKTIGLGAVDRTLGVIFGVLRGIVILGVLYMPVHIFFNQETLNQWFSESKTHFYIATTSDWIVGLMPDSFKDNMDDKVEETAEKMAESTREKLQELDVLRDENKRDSTNDKSVDQISPPKPAQGYEKDQRKDMNDLFKDNYND